MTTENTAKLSEIKETHISRPTDALEVVDPLENIVAEERSNAIFECEVEGYTQPACTWFKDGKPIKPSRKIRINNSKKWHRLEITKVEPEDHGVYTIICKDKSSQTSSQAVLYVAPEQRNSGAIYTVPSPRRSLGVIRHLSNVIINVGNRIDLEVELKTEAIIDYVWFKNDKLVTQNERIIILNSKNTSTLSIHKAVSADSGVYFVVIKTKYGLTSSLTDVQVLDNLSISNGSDSLPLIEEHLPEEVETNEREEIRLTCKIIFNINTTIKWFKNNELIEDDRFVQEDYGNHHIGLRIFEPSRADTAEYSVVLRDEITGNTDSSNCILTVNPSPQKNPPVVQLKRHLESAVACCGSRVVFNCCFALKDPTYFYVVWYVGHYRVERSSSRFSVMCKGGDFLLYIKKLEPGMGGEVVCELRKALSHRRSILINSTAAYLTIAPWSVVEKESNSPDFRRGQVYSDGTESIHICDGQVSVFKDLPLNGNGNGHSLCDPNEFILEIDYCRIEDDGTYFLYSSTVENNFETRLAVHVRVLEHSGGPKKDETKIIVFEWDDFILPTTVWYSIELRQTNGQYLEAGVTSEAMFEVENPPMGKMLGFRIRTLAPLTELYESSVCIAPAHEEILKPVRSYELKPMEQFEATYTKSGDVIGCGAFGSVLLVHDRHGQHYAAKIVKTRTQKKRENALREYETMRQLRHNKLVLLVDAFVARDALALVMDYLWGGELFDRIVEEEHIKEIDVVPYVRQICEALHYLHSLKIAHLDLKPENIICLNPNSGQVKIIDFGLARELVEGHVTRAIYGTRDYVAPEVLNFESLTLACDMWSLGVVTYMLLSGVMPFAGDTWPERSANITLANYNYDDTAFREISDLAKDFVDQLLVLAARKRMTASAALSHRWIVEGPPKGTKAGHMKRTRENLKSYLANYRARWQRAGNVIIASHRLRMQASALFGEVSGAARSAAPRVT